MFLLLRSDPSSHYSAIFLSLILKHSFHMSLSQSNDSHVSGWL